MPRKELQKPDSVRERVTSGPEVPGHQRTAITCKAQSWDVRVRQPWAFQLPGLGDICNAVLACDSLRTHCAQLSTQQMEMGPQMDCVMLCTTSCIQVQKASTQNREGNLRPGSRPREQNLNEASRALESQQEGVL